MKKGRFLNDFDQVTRHNPALQKISLAELGIRDISIPEANRPSI